MGNKTHAKMMKEMHSLLYHLQDHTTFISKIIREYGEVIVPQKKINKLTVYQEDLVHDYVFFCFTKGTRSLIAANALLTEELFEDAKIILRSVYECYINANFATYNPNRINELIELRLGEYIGLYTHPLSKKGSKIIKKLVHLRTNEVFDFNLSIAKMASNTGKEWDAKVHTVLYPYLSEFTHVHMIASGSYRNGTEDHYSVEPDFRATFFSIALSSYVSWLLFDSALEFVISKGAAQKTLFRTHQKSVRFLIKTFHKMQFQNKLINLQDFLINRLRESSNNQS